jgi:hypothetical protein
MAWPVSPTAGLFYAIGDRFWIADGTAWRKYYGGWYEVADLVETAVEEWGTGGEGADDETNKMAFYELIHI